MILSALADPCTHLGVDGVLEKLNTTLGTSYTLGSKILRPSGKTTLHSILKPYVAQNDNFGTVYSHLRRYWYDFDVSAIQHISRAREEKDRKMRKEVIVQDRITQVGCEPSGACGICTLIGWCHTGSRAATRGGYHMRGST